MTDVIFGQSYELQEKPDNRQVIKSVEGVNRRTGVWRKLLW